ncbi:TRAP transporter small permease [Amphritea sp. HPY]|uniref:TRAP transporter small permease n=1 Tax=Amphritea sp. HPY TaxID=3421652 RepID=UPI003D7D9980
MADYTNEFSPAIRIPMAIIMKFMNFVIISSGIIMALTFFFVVIFRYGFGADLFAYEEWLMTIAFWMFFMASAVATHDRVHVNADIVGFLISDPKVIWYRALLVEGIELIIVAVVTYWGFLMCQEEFNTYPNWQSTIALKIPFLVPRVGIFLGFLMMTVYTVLHLCLLFRNGPEFTAPQQPESQDVTK